MATVYYHCGSKDGTGLSLLCLYARYCFDRPSDANIGKKIVWVDLRVVGIFLQEAFNVICKMF
jgi:hypothetical protein